MRARVTCQACVTSLGLVSPSFAAEVPCSTGDEGSCSPGQCRVVGEDLPPTRLLSGQHLPLCCPPQGLAEVVEGVWLEYTPVLVGEGSRSSPQALSLSKTPCTYPLQGWEWATTFFAKINPLTRSLQPSSQQPCRRARRDPWTTPGTSFPRSL